METVRRHDTVGTSRGLEERLEAGIVEEAGRRALLVTAGGQMVGSRHRRGTGDATHQPHLVRGEGTIIGFGPSGTRRRSWWDYAEAFYDAPLRMHYAGLDPAANYKIRVVYSGDARRIQIRLAANINIEIHPLTTRPSPPKPLEFDIPPEATRGGQLDLSWTREQGLGGNGRGCQVSEVWLIRK